MDSETQKVYSEGEALSDYIKTKAWKQVREIFNNKILDLQSTRNIKPGKPEDIAFEVATRNGAADILLEVIKEVEGEATKFDSNKSLMSDYISTFESPQ